MERRRRGGGCTSSRRPTLSVDGGFRPRRCRRWRPRSSLGGRANLHPTAGSPLGHCKTAGLRPAARAATVYLAGAAAAKLYGGASAGKLPAVYQATHDLGVSAMFLRLLRDDPPAVARWIGEDRLAPYRRRQKLPDAVLADGPDAEPELVLEFGGSYDKRRVAAFHRDCARRGLAYEVW